MKISSRLPLLMIMLFSFPVVRSQALTIQGGPDTRHEVVFFSFDDYSIPWKHNLKLTLVQAEKHPSNPVLHTGPDGAPDHRGAILYGSVIKIDKKFRMWYLGRAETKFDNGQPPLNWTPLCYAESVDGVNWTKPELGLVSFNGNKRNNMCRIEGSPHSLTVVNDFVSVLYDPDDPDPNRLYKAVYISYPPSIDVPGGLSNIGTREDSTIAAVCMTSADGRSWKLAGNPANAGGERFEVTGLYKFDNFYYATGQLLYPWAWLPDGRDGGQIMQVYRSPDFLHWSKAKAFSFARPGQLTNPSVRGQDTHMGAGLWNRGNVLVGLYGIWQDAPLSPPTDPGISAGVDVDLGLLVSNDGIHYREPVADFKIISRGNKNDWDDIALLHAHAFANEADKTMIWYSNMDVTGKRADQKEIGLATLRRDGFGYLSRKEDDNDATCTTATFSTGLKNKLVINVDGITNDAPLTIELLDERDRPIIGYAGKAAARVISNGTQLEIVWPTVQSPLLPSGREVAVRVNLPVNSSAKIFALYIRE